MSFTRALVTTDDNNQDLDLNQCVYLLRAWGGSVSSYNSPAVFGFHPNQGVFSTQLCLQDCVGKYNYHFVLLSAQNNSWVIQNQLSIHCKNRIVKITNVFVSIVARIQIIIS